MEDQADQIEQAGQIIEWFGDLKQSNDLSHHLHLLGNARNKLAAIHFAVSKLCGDQNHIAASANFSRKLSHNEKTLEAIARGESATRAAMIATQDTKELFQIEVNQESKAKKTALLTRSISISIQAISQEISTIKAEKETLNHST